jgi:hypothetical protein
MSTAGAQGCERKSAPIQWSEHKPWVPWNRTDTGLVLQGFVDLKTQNGDVWPLMHGTDLSSNNEVDYAALRECGGTFALVRVDERFQTHFDGFVKQALIVVPYVFINIPVSLRHRSNYTDMTEWQIAQYAAKFEKIGQDAATRDLRKFGQIPKTLFEHRLPGFNRSVVALDVEQKLVNHEGSTELQRVYYGRFYAKAVCRWINIITRTRPELTIMLYTTPSVYGEYFQKVDPVENVCLNGLPIWIARTTSDGGDVHRESSSSTDTQVQKMCFASGGNRCIVHQYSHRAVFAAIGTVKDGIPPHIDVDRLFAVKEVQNAVGIQIVRNVSP